ncbi:MAG: hypothetical protein IPK05_17895 [Comamonadaceae bacterium]|nr:hypothetical protein [Comamonadaceae bacterium]
MTPYEDFLAAFPDYAITLALDDLRAKQYARLDRQDQVYLDYTGGGLYAASQVQEHAAMLAEQVLGNPHSVNPSSTETTRRVEGAAPRCWIILAAPRTTRRSSRSTPRAR